MLNDRPPSSFYYRLNAVILPNISVSDLVTLNKLIYKKKKSLNIE